MHLPAYNNSILFIAVGLRSSLNVKDQVSLYPYEIEFCGPESLRFLEKRAGRQKIFH